METTSFFRVSTELILRNDSDSILTNMRNSSGRSFSLSYSVSWATYASLTASVILLSLGLFGNTVTIILMRKKPFRSNAHGLYLTALAIADTASLLVVPMRKRFTFELSGRDIRALSNIGCQLYAYAYRTTKLCSSSFVVLICFERFAALWFPIRAKTLSSRRTGLILVLSIFAVLLTVSILFASQAGVKYERCFHDMSSENDLLSKISSNLSWALSTIIPTVLLLLLTPLTVFKLYRQRSMRNRMGGQEKSKGANYSYITTMLMSAVIAYVFLITSFTAVFQSYKLQGINLARSEEPWAIAFIEILSLSEQINYAINFFLYGLFNAEFRQKFIAMFSCKYHRKDDIESSMQSFTNTTGKLEYSKSTSLH